MGGVFDPAIALAAAGALAFAGALAAAACRATATPERRITDGRITDGRLTDGAAPDRPAGVVEGRAWAAAFAALAGHWSIRLAAGPAAPAADAAPAGVTLSSLAHSVADGALLVAAALLLFGLIEHAGLPAGRRLRRRRTAAPAGLVALAALPPAVLSAGTVLPGPTAGTVAGVVDGIAGAVLVAGGLSAVLVAGPPGRRLAAPVVAAFGLIWLAGAVGGLPEAAALPARAAGALALGAVLAATVAAVRRSAVEAELAVLRRRVADSEEAQERRALARAKTEFLASISHELRTPLNAIIGFSEIIRDRHFGSDALDRYADCARDIHTSGTHLMAVLDDVLEMSRIEGGRYRLRRETVLIGEVAEDCRRIVIGPAAERGLLVDLAIDPACPPIVADPRALKQIFINLLSNAVKFTPEGGRVTAFARPGPATADGSWDGLVFGVRDTGVGIPAADIPLVREPFRQGTWRPAHAVVEGTGLGLAIVDRLVSLHRGRLTIDSVVGRGTTVTVHLPTAEPAAAVEAHAPVASAESA